MQLIGFRIQNFRSIVDTGWQQLAHDNITSLIGQNESGKTSILEGLKAFHDGRLIEDMLRSDLSIPKVSCQFKSSIKDLEKHIDLKKLDPKVRQVLGSLENISISRVWEDDMDSYMEMGAELEDIYHETLEKIRERESLILEKLEEMNREVAEISATLDRASDDYNLTLEKVDSVKQRIGEIKRSGRKFSSREKREEIKKEIGLEEEMLTKLNEVLALKKSTLDEKAAHFDAFKLKVQARDKLEELSSQIDESSKDLTATQESLREILQLTGMYPSDKEQRAAEIREEIARADIDKLRDELQKLKQQYDTHLLSLEFVFEGMTFESAIKSAGKEIALRHKYISSRELAQLLFTALPEFELFED
ncbi:MAG: AAA family ATPase, partial [Bacteroides sp.]|nr:AAA family ATPase [Bacteroides sp.]